LRYVLRCIASGSFAVCVAEFHEPRKSLSRRRLVKLGALTAATAALAGQLDARSAQAQAQGAPLRNVSIDNIVDLTHVLLPTTPIWPDTPVLSVKNLATYEPNGYFANQITVAEHHGTHLDAPMHFAKGGWSTAEIPAAALVAPAVVVDLRP
jgi:hypothetical protein